MGPNQQLIDIATTLVENCQKGDDRKNLNELYAEHAESVEAFAPPGEDRIKKGLDAIRAKHDWWEAHMEELSDGPQGADAAQGPFFNGDDRFSVIFRAKVRNRESGEIMDLFETATYTVEDGKIVREEFFYAM